MRDIIHSEFMSCYESDDDDKDTAYMYGGDVPESRSKWRRLGNGQSLVDFTNEIDQYLKSPIILQNKNPLEWWGFEYTSYPNLAETSTQVFVQSRFVCIFRETLFRGRKYIWRKKGPEILPGMERCYIFLHLNMNILRIVDLW